MYYLCILIKRSMVRYEGLNEGCDRMGLRIELESGMKVGVLCWGLSAEVIDVAILVV